MTSRKTVKYVHVDRFVAEVDVELLYDDSDWSPYLRLDDAKKLDEVRDSLRRADLKTASRFARVFEMMPVAV